MHISQLTLQPLESNIRVCIYIAHAPVFKCHYLQFTLYMQSDIQILTFTRNMTVFKHVIQLS